MLPNIYLDDLPDKVQIKNEIAIDTECMGLNIHRDRLCLVQMADHSGQVYMVKYNEKSKFKSPNLCKILQDPTILKIFHFGRFDIAVLKHYLQTEINNIFCTKIASRLARTYTERHSLQELCSEVLKLKINKMQQSSDWGANELNEKQIDYAATDVIHLIAIKNHLLHMIQREQRTKLLQNCLKSLNTVTDLDLAGWTIEGIFNHH